MAVSKLIVRATLDGVKEPIEVATDNRDTVRWDLERHQKNWPAAQDAPVLWMTFVAWAAAARSGKTTLKWAEWQQRCTDISKVESEAVDPFPQESDTES